MTSGNADWYRDWFNDTYLQVYSHRNEEQGQQEVAQLIHLLSPEPDDHILDLCCGAGRHLHHFHAMGFKKAVGLDLSPALLSRARETLSTTSRLVRGDMRDLPFGGVFDLVACFFTSFGYFHEEAENQRVLNEIQRVLKRGGLLFLDLPSHSSMENLVPRSEKSVSGLNIFETRRYHPETRRVEKTIEVSQEDRIETFRESVRIYSFKEAMRMLAQAGLCLMDARGDHDGSPLDTNSPRMILICRNTPCGEL